MSRGPVPIPNAMKLLAGNPGNRPINRAEPIPPPGAPIPPGWLAPPARALWNQVAKPLIETRLATSIDWPLLARYCELFSEWLELMDLTHETGFVEVAELVIEDTVKDFDTGRKAPPKRRKIYGKAYTHAKAMLKLNEALIKMEDRLGMNPAVRSRMTVPLMDGGNAGVDPADARRRAILLGQGVAGQIRPAAPPPPPEKADDLPGA